VLTNRRCLQVKKNPQKNIYQPPPPEKKGELVSTWDEGEGGGWYKGREN